jgi:hypothetical protein
VGARRHRLDGLRRVGVGRRGIVAVVVPALFEQVKGVEAEDERKRTEEESDNLHHEDHHPATASNHAPHGGSTLRADEKRGETGSNESVRKRGI